MKEHSVNLHWVAEYKDGSTLTEQDYSYVNLPRLNLTNFGLFTENNQPVAVVQLGKNKVLFYRSRVILDLTGNSKRVYLVGFRTPSGQTHLKIVDQDGKLSSWGSFQEAKQQELEYYPVEQV